MATTQYAAAPRALNQVQNVMRWLIGLLTFFVVFIVLGLIGLLVSTLAGAVIGEVGVGAMCLAPWAVVAGIVGLVMSGAVSRCFYISPEYQRVVVLKLGEFVGVRGPRRFWVIPYPPYYQSAAMTLDRRWAKINVVRPSISRSSASWMTASFTASTDESASSSTRMGASRSTARQRPR